ncbi:NAD(P)-binding protein [candidate division KSB1 bacterium]
MAKLVKKKKKKKLGGSAFSGRGGSSVETSNRRPYYVSKVPPCEEACPNANNIRKVLNSFVTAEKKEIPYDDIIQDAWFTLTEKNPFPAVCGRVCPHPCESSCNRNEKDQSVAINNIERFIGDFGIKNDLKHKKGEASFSEKVAIIGAGPSGLSCAFQLAKLGYKVTVFEAFDKPGGMLFYGIPAYRLPREILDAEINKIKELGVEIKCNTCIGKDVPYEDLKKDYDAIFVGIGAHKGKLLRVDGEDAANVFTGTEFLNKVNSGKPVEIGNEVLIIGGGDTAIDAARMAKRLGANATIVYRRTRTEMPAIEEEIEGALEEGIKIDYLVAPVNIIKDGDNAVKMVCQKMELGEPDDSGRRRPVPVEGSEYELPCTAIIAAISQEPEFDGLENTREGRDWIKTDKFGQLLMGGQPEDKVFAGGDVLDLGLATIAIFHGRLAAKTIHERFRGIESTEEEKLPVITHDKMMLGYYQEKLRNEVATLPVEKRFDDPDAEIASTLEQDQAVEEALRCMSCASCFDCGTCWSYCQDGAIVKPALAGEIYKFKMEFCKGCDKCAENCPCGYIEMK